jgi:energy-coupling factor transporter ATP-binding protein EcfA2
VTLRARWVTLRARLGDAESSRGDAESSLGDVQEEVKLQKGPTLSDIELHLKPGSLNLVVGPVGSGKSSLLATLTDDINVTRGTVGMAGTVAYVAQTAFILNDTLQNNVLFSLPMDRKKYQQVHSLTATEKVANPDVGDLGGRDRSRGRFATPADFPRHDCSPYSHVHVRRESVGCVHRSGGHSLSPPCQSLTIRFATCSSL